MNRARTAAVMAIAIAIVVAGCGDSDDTSTDARAPAVEPPSIPDARACDAQELATAVRPDRLVPASGTYRYQTKGTRTVSSSDGEPDVKQLPAQTEVVITPAKSFGGLRCFRVQRKLTKTIADTATLVVRGSDLYLTEVLFETNGQRDIVRPRPPVHSLDPDETEWAGAFRGATSGSYRATSLGRRQMRVADRRARALGVQLQLSLAGDVEATEVSTRWLLPSRNLNLSERVLQKRDFGLDRITLRYSSTLESLNPR